MGYFAVFQILKYNIKQEIKNAIKSEIPDNKLTVISVSEENIAEITWFENGKEFMYKDKLYDIIRTTQMGSITTYYCINDTQEKELFTNLNEHIENHVKNDLSKNKQTKTVLKKVIKDYLFTAKYHFANNSYIKIIYPSKSETEATIFMEITVPPPKQNI